MITDLKSCYQEKCFLIRPDVWPGVRPWTSGRTVVGGARVVSGAEKKAFDRGGPVWPPRSNAADDRSGGGSGRVKPPQPKTGGSGGQRPPAKNFRKYFEKFRKNLPDDAALCLGTDRRTVTVPAFAGHNFKEINWKRDDFVR